MTRRSTPLWDRIAEAISAATGEPFVPRHQHSLGGGCINAAYALEGEDGRRYFVKLNQASKLEMFEAEVDGLRELAAAAAIRVPGPVVSGSSGDSAYLVLEHIAFGHGKRSGLAAFGRRFAQLHRTTRAEYGWGRDNTIGATPQPNTPDTDWVRFWRDRRLGFQLDLAARKGHGGSLQRQGDRLRSRVDVLLAHRPPASLLHGDLWGGNYAMDTEGQPVIFDPAVYFGDREADLAMTELFGGFGDAFYAAYREAYPLDPAYSVRRTLYNLYHVLNHLNLFGGGYQSQAEQMIARLLSEVR
jgi:protein-ribulosamine 3-kinase